MSHIAHWISSLLLALLLALLPACSLFEKAPDVAPNRPVRYKQKVFYSTYDEVWRAAHAALKYPIVVDNQDTGVIETDYIKGIDGWLLPESSAPSSSGLRYKITLLFAQGKFEGKDSIRVTIEKKIEVLRDFFSDPQSLESDSLEEKVIFYRIEREIIINKALQKAGI